MLRQARLRSAFTLIEIIAAAAIMLAVVSMVLQLTTDVLNTWNHTSSRLSTNFEARQAFELIVSDIEAAIIKEDGNPWFYIGLQDVQDMDDTVNLYFFSSTNYRPRTYFNASGTELNLKGNVCAVNYRIAWQNPFNPADVNAARKRYSLYRAVIDPEITATKFLGATTITTPWGTANADPDDLLDASLERTYTGTANDYAKEPFNLVALRVIDLQVDVIHSTGEINSNAGATITLPGDLGANVLNAIRVQLRVLTEEGEELVRFGSGDLTDADFVSRYTDAFSRVIPLQVNPF